MKRLFIHHPLFRLLSPLFSGTVVYFLILLINNNVEQLQSQFLGQELYLCVGLSFLIQELSRALVLIFSRYLANISFLTALVIQVITSLLLCVVVVTVAIRQYYKHILGFSPNSEELWMFNSIFCTIALIYILLHLSHVYLHKVNTRKLALEIAEKQGVEEDFIAFREGINPELLFDSFEALITRLRSEDSLDDVDTIVDNTALTYRYSLSRTDEQLVPISEELNALNPLVALVNYLPYRNVTVDTTVKSHFLCIPGSLVKLVETIVRSTIRNHEEALRIEIGESEEAMTLAYTPNDRLDRSVNQESISELRRVYAMYSEKEVSLSNEDTKRIISLPKLTIEHPE